MKKLTLPRQRFKIKQAIRICFVSVSLKEVPEWLLVLEALGRHPGLPELDYSPKNIHHD
jgi:hypothetical protein